MNKRIFFLAVFATLCLFSCTSPEKDGASLGAKINKCNENHLKALQQLDADFGKNASYNSRKEAKSAYYNAKEIINEKYENATDAIYHTAQLNKEKYKNSKSQAQYYRAFNSAIDRNLQISVNKTAENSELPASVLTCLSSINPPRPDILQIQKDLVGHSLSEGVQNGYYPSNWRWVIKEHEISNFQIEEVLSNTPTEYMLIAIMRLTSDMGKAFDATVKIRYVLPRNDDWIIEFAQSQGLYIVKSDKYIDCISCEIYKGAWSWYYCLENNCEIALEVGGRILESGKWEKFSKIVAAHSKETIGWVVEDGRIDYVEIP